MRNFESATHVLTPLRPGQSDLRNRWADALEHTGSKLEALLSHGLQSDPGNRFSLVEAALSPLRNVQRHRDDENRSNEFQLGNGLCEHATQNCRCRMHLIVFQQVYQLAEFTVIRAVSHCSLIRRASPPAQITCVRFFPGIDLRQQFSANRASRALDWRHGLNAI